ncbi:uncharacterized protein CPUR_01704 [Claviceps purpurea 20.1]|uniref:Uncharacterized protein n=1 Tax=Claviceps purpurea (strain 20.1) TaxID=1111077 RepID=M1W361_CLAP2|nr:uncharacterized protein CPUR_01704 [Claviceps purpurea 20.1]
MRNYSYQICEKAEGRRVEQG